MMRLGDDPYSAGFAAGLEGAGACPHWPWSVDWWFWHAGQYAGHETRCAQYQHILMNFPQD